MGNFKDNMMEAIANNGNGNYAYIDTIQEARNVLSRANDSSGEDTFGLKAEFIDLVQRYGRMINY